MEKLRRKLDKGGDNHLNINSDPHYMGSENRGKNTDTNILGKNFHGVPENEIRFGRSCQQDESKKVRNTNGWNCVEEFGDVTQA